MEILIKKLEEKEWRLLSASLITLTLGIVLLNIVSALDLIPFWQIRRLIDVGEESNFTTWFSSIMLAIAAYFAYQCSVAAESKKDGKRMWQLLSLGLLGMSCDEVAMIHEHLGKVILFNLFTL